MARSDYDQEVKKMLQEEIEIPKAVEDSLEDAYDKIRRGEVKMKQLQGRKRKRLYQKAGIAAAAACMVIALTGIFYANPALAKDIPILGDVFKRIQEKRDESPYPDKDKTAYDKIAEHSKPVEDPTNVAVDQGVTMKVSDAYCDGYDLYFTLSLTTEDEEMNTADRITLLSYREGDPIPFLASLAIDGEEVYPSSSMTVNKMDDNVYAALIRVQSMSMPKGTFPEKMSVSLDVGGVCGQKDGMVETGAVSGFKNIDGSWKLAFDARMDTSNNTTAKPQTEKDGFVVEEVTKTPSNMYITLAVPAEWAVKNPAEVLMDTAGNRIYGESSRIVEQEDGSWIKYMIFDQTDADQFTLKMYDKNADIGENESVPLITEISFSME